MGRALRFTPGARTRVGQILGWIVGLSQSAETRPFAEKAAEDIFRSLDMLCQYGGTVDDPFHGKKPQYIVEVGDDGTFGGFTLAWMCAVEHERQAEIPEAKFKTQYDERYGAKSIRYVYSFNGGLLYHGPRAGQTFAMNLGSSNHLWSIHT